MSMLDLGRPKDVPAKVLTPVRAAIFGQLRAHGERSTAQLLEALLAVNLVTADDLARDPYWMQKSLARLRSSKRIDKRINEAGKLVWFEGQAPQVTATPAPESTGRVAAPRHINVMHGPQYQPAPWVPARAGALDHVNVDSLIGGRRVAFGSVA
ncbi:hypothetical protein [Variovorax boronicumulans]|uniref:hypothetical protein n=1 Tax=Variovorax boronicumulans TaxID=436515 RepID=UPI001C593521